MSTKNVRNISVIAHVDHGKSSTTDLLVAKAGLISDKEAGTKRWSDTREDEQARGITIKSTGVTLKYSISEVDYTINLVDSPGHIDFSQEVSAALRITDGALVLVDAVEGVCVQTETVLRQALAEQVKPILYINKLDRSIFELQLSAEEIYQNMVRIINQVNEIIRMYRPEGSKVEADEISPEKGNVAFGTAYYGWGFTLKQFADRLAPAFKKDVDSVMKMLWGEKYFNNATKKMVSQPSSGDVKNERTFCKFVLDPILTLARTTMNGEKDKYEPLLKKINISLTSQEADLAAKEIYKVVMRRFLPLADALLQGIIEHLPSPTTAQQYRVNTLYDGPLDDECANAIRNCDENGPLVVYISKMIPMDGGRFYAFGRVFAGTAQAGQKVRVMGANYIHGSNDDYSQGVSIQRVAKMIGGRAETCESVPCGNTVALVGVDKYLAKSGTITTSPSGYPIKTMKFSVSPIVQVAVRPKNAADLPKLVEALKKLSKSDPCVRCFCSDTGDNIVAGVGELHVEICLNDLRDFLKSDIIVDPPIVPLRETVVGISSQVCLSKSPNKHNRLFVTAEPLDTKLVDAMIKGEITMRDDLNKRGRFLVDNYDWDPTDAKKTWSFAPEGAEPSNMLVDTTKGVQYLLEIKEHVDTGFKNLMLRGPLCNEPVRGVRFNLNDVVLHADAIHRGGGQLIPPTMRVMAGAILTAKPAIMEPVYMTEIQVPSTYVGAVYNCLQNKRGEVFSQEQLVGELYVIKGYLPVLESFGFSSFIREHTAGQASPQLNFDHWQVVDGDPFDKNSPAGKIVAATRKRKDLPEIIPGLDNYIDKL